ncbi:fimbrial protein [Cronobacter turicensis]|nr:type 1 fimbrial protein [Cronobacter turicensis]
MKKLTSVLALGVILSTGIAQAADNDVAATLSVSGTVKDTSIGCTVEFIEPTVNMGTREISSLPKQGHHVDGGQLTPVTAKLVGNCTRDGSVTSNITFTGVVDSGAGNALVNTATGSGAATGLGVGIYSYAGNIITPNVSVVKATGLDSTMFYIGMVTLDGTNPAAGQVQSSLTLQVLTL